MTKKENQNRGPRMNSPTLPQKIFKFFATSPVPIRRSGQAFMVIGPRIAANYGLQIQVFSVKQYKTPRSLRRFDHIKLFPQRDEHLFFSVPGVRDH